MEKVTGGEIVRAVVMDVYVQDNHPQGRAPDVLVPTVYEAGSRGVQMIYWHTSPREERELRVVFEDVVVCFQAAYVVATHLRVVGG